MIPWKINNRKRSYSKKNEVESRTEQTQLFPCKEKEMATIDLTDGGRPQVGAQEVRHAHSSMVTRRGDKEKATRDSEHPVRNFNDSLRRIEISNRTGMSPARRGDRPPCLNYKKEQCLNDNNCDFWHPPCCKCHKRNQ